MPQELSSVSAGPNETVVLKKKTRASLLVWQRKGNITFSTEDANIDNATDEDRKVVAGAQVTRVSEAVLAESVQHNGTVTFQDFLKIGGKFYEKWKAEDLAAQVPPP